MTLRQIHADSSKWDEIVRSMNGHNVYQSAAYHRLAEKMDGGKATLFLFEQDSRRAAIPLIIREIDTSPGKPKPPGQSKKALRDATSVYGYPGILTNCGDAPATFIHQFQTSLRDALQQSNIVTVFVRLGVFHRCSKLIEGLGSIENVGNTVAIDLANCAVTRFKNYRRNHRTNIKQLRAIGAQTDADLRFEHLSSFADTYHRSMHRVGASDWFSFGLEYFRNLCNRHPEEIVLLRTRVEDDLACGGMFFFDGEVAYAHLTATSDDWVGKSPTKVMFDDAANYFKHRGCRWLHLGGGLGANEDSLYRFKCGFSKQRIPFRVWKYVVDMESYQELCQLNDGPNGSEKYESFFPQYRSRKADRPAAI